MKKQKLLILLAVVMAVITASAGAGVIYTEGFEDPVIEGQYVIQGFNKDGDWPGWVGAGQKYAGVVHSDAGQFFDAYNEFGDQIAHGLVNQSGDQAMYLFNNLPGENTNISVTTAGDPDDPNCLNTLIEANTTYSLTLKTASTFMPNMPQNYHVQLIAADSGTVLDEVIGPVMDSDFLTQGNQIAFAYRTGDSPETLGERLAVRLRKGNGAYYHNVYYDDIRVFEDKMNVSPFDGESVGYGNVDLAWDNKDAFVGDTVWVEVMYGKDPNSNNPTYDWNKVMMATADVNNFSVTAELGTTYHWQVISYLYGDSTTDPCESDIYTFTALADMTVQSVAIEEEDTVTWSGEPVQLHADVDDDGSSPVEYEWSCDLDSAVFSSTTDANPTITITKDVGVGLIPIANPGFESLLKQSGEWKPLGIGLRDYVSTQTYGWLLPNWGYTYNGNCGVYSPAWNAYGMNFAPEGANVGFVDSRAGEGYFTAAGGLDQKTNSVLKAGVTYTLSVKIGNPNFNTDFPGYKVQLAAGGTVLAEDVDSLEPAPGTFEQSTISFTTPADHAKLGERLEVRLYTTAKFVSAEDDQTTTYEVHFDDVQLTSDNGTTVHVTLSAKDAVTPAMTGTITIDVYDNACQAKISTSQDEIDKGDINEDCITDIDDLKLVATAWLVDSGLDASVNSSDGDVVGDPNVLTVNAGGDVITWSDEPVTLAPTIVDLDPNVPQAALTYAWSADPADGVAFSATDVEAPTVTITNAATLPTYAPFIANGSFEEPVTADGGTVNSGSVPSWSSGWSDPAVGTWNDRTDRGGVRNPQDTEYALIPDGENVGWATIDDASDHCVHQQLSITLQPSTDYVLSVKVGNPTDAPTANYRVELVAGEDILTAGVLASATGASPNGTTDPEWFDVSVPYTSGAAPAADKLGVRLIAEKTEGDSLKLNFDEATLSVDGVVGTEIPPTVEMLSVTLSLAVNKEGSEKDDVVDTMKIDVYGDSCLALAAAGQPYAQTDLDGNCITNLVDIAEVAKSWLNSLDVPTAPFAMP